MNIFEKIRLAFQRNRASSWTLNLRLIVYMLCFALLLIGVIFGSVMLLGRVSVVNKQTQNMLETHLLIYEQDITNYFDHLAALGIRLSKDLSLEIEAGGYQPKMINGNPAAIVEMEQHLYDTLYRALQLANCSGAYFMLDATANLQIPGADVSKCGLYIKIANINVRAPVDMKILQYRGSTEIGNKRGIEYHNKWVLEYDSSLFPNYDLLINSADKNLNNCFIFSNAHTLPGTWENVMLFSVPIIGSDGTVYGLCGYEVSAIFFKLHHALSGAEPRMAGLVAPYGPDENTILADYGLQNGNRTNYYADLSGVITIKNEKYFDVFNLSGNRKFAGVHKPVTLSPLGDVFSLSVMIPKADYDAEEYAEIRENIILLLLLIIAAVFGCIIISRRFVMPILSSFNSIQSGELDKTNIKEIDNFLEYIGRLMEERKALDEVKPKPLLVNTKKKTPVQVREEVKDNLQKAAMFDKLSYQELRVAEMTLRGYSYTQIADVLELKPNTVKWYQKILYSKLGISSKRELFELAAKKN